MIIKLHGKPRTTLPLYKVYKRFTTLRHMYLLNLFNLDIFLFIIINNWYRSSWKDVAVTAVRTGICYLHSQLLPLKSIMCLYSSAYIIDPAYLMIPAVCTSSSRSIQFAWYQNVVFILYILCGRYISYAAEKDIFYCCGKNSLKLSD